jgi:RNA polymerase sigma-70 factor, ECF subfamily
MDVTERVLTLPLQRARRSLAQEPSENLTSSIHTDEELFDRILRREEEALLTLFRRYNRLVFSIGYRVLRDVGEAEDLVQEIFLRLHRGECSFDSAKGPARAWFVQMSHRRAFDRRAYLTRRHFYSGTDFEEHTNAVAGKGNVEEEVIERLTPNN